MTSKNSFWVSCIENHRRRVWVWIVAVLFQAVSYVGVLTVYLSRIRMWNEEGTYKTAADFQDAMYQATQDALGFQDNMFPILVGLAVIIGMQGFSYLYDRKKVDLYHSVPVDKDRRFFVVYLNGIVIYLVTTLLNILISVIMAMVQQAVNEKVMAVIGLGFVWNLLAFSAMYNTVVLAVMVTGNRLVTLCAAGVLVVYEAVIYHLFNSLQYAFLRQKIISMWRIRRNCLCWRIMWIIPGRSGHLKRRGRWQERRFLIMGNGTCWPVCYWPQRGSPTAEGRRRLPAGRWPSVYWNLL